MNDISLSSRTGGDPRPKATRRTMLLLIALFVLPFVLSGGLFWSGWHPARFSNRGELIDPPYPLPAGGLRGVAGRPLPSAMLRGKWLLLFPDTGDCATDCQQRLHDMQQVHLALNKERGRLTRIFIAMNGTASAHRDLERRFPGLVVTELDGTATGGAWREALPRPGQMAIVDPFGKLMMRYPLGADMRGVLKDLERLLKYSWSIAR